LTIEVEYATYLVLGIGWILSGECGGMLASIKKALSESVGWEFGYVFIHDIFITLQI
jgi:hypothetical protein